MIAIAAIQVFVVQADTGRSSRFPVIVRTLDLRSILGSPDLEGIASTAASAIMEAYENLEAWLGAVKEVTGHATQVDVALLLQLRNVYKQLLPAAQTQLPPSLCFVAADIVRLRRKEAVPLPPSEELARVLLEAGNAETTGEELLPSAAVAPQLRLRARLHLEALKILEWCFIVMATEQPS
ncbi:hypothetical protein COCSUDRAFT_57366 [Coccomyxa subellipsoidea C-169]|uniref:Uncharacterized protein n=1 Tax=Coccomyxa subellipsoidea (strain C-169) TaxID=574566 RepID=I0YQZ3_COCSC|nr:hypothetical protein COCSUDRAFT_57366 [Coccomyxa subellipsoidea C-169]EIE20812.1 hypothetical protein COCSUDRAFT_57366 [Coccomyxa subellipsoidea C-169]|eukprot:XP_005645356.1 hypothetical protein COCSUDRAFT_57366 [Coccomyxa subellipsoidea C-169]